MKFVTLLIAPILISTSLAYASKDRGGGDAVQANGRWSLLDLNEALPLDYFDPYADKAVLEEVQKAELNLGECHNAFREYSMGLLYMAMLELRGQIYVTRGNLAWDPWLPIIGPKLTWVQTETPLENIKDEGLIRLSDTHKRQQLAAQKDGVVMVYMPIYRKLDAKNKAALLIHETLLRVILRFRPEVYTRFGTAKIRELVNYAFTKNFYGLHGPALDRICGTTSDLLGGHWESPLR